MYFLKFSLLKISLFSLLKILKLVPALFSQNFLVRSYYLELLIIGVVFLHYIEREERSVWFVLYPYFSSFFFFCSFSISIFLDRH